MKSKKLIKFVSLFSAMALMITSVSAQNTAPIKDIPIGSSGNSIEMVGTIQPTIMSVTMPSSVSFNISKSIPEQNKVISPRINVKNNSNIPVDIDINYVNVNLSKMTDTYWNNNGNVGNNEIAIGLKKETELNQMPTDLSQANWLKHGSQYINVLKLAPNGADAMYVVGALGADVPENATFSVIPTFVARGR